MTFTPMPWENPRDLEDKVPIRYSDKESSQVRILANPNGFERSNHHNVFEVSSPSFSLGDKTLVSLNINDLEYIKDYSVKEKLINECITQCRDFFIQNASEIRRDYSCSLDISHRLFVNFRIYDSIKPEDIVEYSNKIIEGEDESTKAYDYLHD